MYAKVFLVFGQAVDKKFSSIAKAEGVDIRRGCVVCQAEKLTYITEDYISLPVEYL